MRASSDSSGLFARALSYEEPGGRLAAIRIGRAESAEGEQKTKGMGAYKSEERRKIVDAGYRIVMSVGDQWIDLNGDPGAEICVGMPNPFYYLP